jgi:hypothetical protein
MYAHNLWQRVHCHLSKQMVIANTLSTAAPWCLQIKAIQLSSPCSSLHLPDDEGVCVIWSALCHKHTTCIIALVFQMYPLILHQTPLEDVNQDATASGAPDSMNMVDHVHDGCAMPCAHTRLVARHFRALRPVSDCSKYISIGQRREWQSWSAATAYDAPMTHSAGNCESTLRGTHACSSHLQLVLHSVF